MHITAGLVPGFRYSSQIHEFPIDIELSTELPTEIYAQVYVSGILLISLERPGVEFGYAQRVTPALKKAVTLSPQEPLRMRVDALEHDDEFDDLLPGDYRCDIKVEVFRKEGGVVELQGSVTTTLT